MIGMTRTLNNHITDNRRDTVQEYKRMTYEDKYNCVQVYSEFTENECLRKLAEFEDKLEQGTLVELPCKVGDTVYIITRKRDCSACYLVQDYCHHDCPFKNDKYDLVVKEGKISYIRFNRPYSFKPEIGIAIKEDKQLQQEEYDVELWKESDEIFLTKPKAEAKLKELRGKYEILQ